MRWHVAWPLVPIVAGVFSLAGCGDLDDESLIESQPEPTPADTTPTATATAGPTKAPDPQSTEVESSGEAATGDIPYYEFPSGNQSIYLMDADGGNQRQLTDDQNQYLYAAWSPDGARIATITQNREQPGQRIFVMDADGSNLQELTDQAGHGPISWSPDSETIAYGTASNPEADAEEIYLIDADGSNQRQLTCREGLPAEESYTAARAPAWSPDGQSIIFTAMRLEHENSGNAVVELYSVDIEGDGAPRRLTDSPDLQKSDPAWHPSGDLIAFTGYDVNEHRYGIYTVSPDGEHQQLLNDEALDARQLAWDPPGERLAFVREAFGSLDIHVMNADGSDLQQLTDDSQSNTSPDWSPDGSQITFIASRDARMAQPCSYTEMADLAPSEPFEELAWISHQVATGTVVEKWGSSWIEPDPDHPGRSGQCLQIVTDYLVEIDTHYRGEPADPLRVRVRGGEVADYVQDIDPSPEIEEGDRLLMFLNEAPESEWMPEGWMALPQRVWKIDEEGQIHGNPGLDDFEMLPLEEVDKRIRDTLSGDSHILGTRNVPEDEAPIHVERSESEEQ